MAEKFHERFGLDVGTAEARRRFVNRIVNLVLSQSWKFHDVNDEKLLQRIAHEFGEPYALLSSFGAVELYVKKDFFRTLKVLEIIWQDCPHARVWLHETLRHLLTNSEANLGIEWNLGKFRPAGAALLDETLGRQVLDWLNKEGLRAIAQPYEKALRELVFAEKQPERLPDAITDAYEALEAMAKRLTRRDVDLSKNREQFIARLKTSAEYRKILNSLLRDYVEYGCRFRHAASEERPKPLTSMAEAESFIYVTGIILRLGTLSEW